MKYYAVRKGRKPGIYNTWDECKEQVDKFKGEEYKKFKTEEEALEYINRKEIINKEKKISELKEGEVIAYVDGSYNDDNKEYGWGYVILTKDKEIKRSGKGNNPNLLKSRNISAELLATVMCLREVKDLKTKKIYLHHDYQGISKLINGEWKPRERVSKNYKKIVEEYKEHFEIEFIKIKSHSGNKYNDIADELARV